MKTNNNKFKIIYWFHLKMFPKANSTVSKTTISQITSSILSIALSLLVVLMFNCSSRSNKLHMISNNKLLSGTKNNIKGRGVQRSEHIKNTAKILQPKKVSKDILLPFEDVSKNYQYSIKNNDISNNFIYTVYSNIFDNFNDLKKGAALLLYLSAFCKLVNSETIIKTYNSTNTHRVAFSGEKFAIFDTNEHGELYIYELDLLGNVITPPFSLLDLNVTSVDDALYDFNDNLVFSVMSMRRDVSGSVDDILKYLVVSIDADRITVNFYINIAIPPSNIIGLFPSSSLIEISSNSFILSFNPKKDLYFYKITNGIAIDRGRYILPPGSPLFPSLYLSNIIAGSDENFYIAQIPKLKNTFRGQAVILIKFNSSLITLKRTSIKGLFNKRTKNALFRTSRNTTLLTVKNYISKENYIYEFDNDLNLVNNQSFSYFPVGTQEFSIDAITETNQGYIFSQVAIANKTLYLNLIDFDLQYNNVSVSLHDFNDRYIKLLVQKDGFLYLFGNASFSNVFIKTSQNLIEDACFVNNTINSGGNPLQFAVLSFGSPLLSNHEIFYQNTTIIPQANVGDQNLCIDTPAPSNSPTMLTMSPTASPSMSPTAAPTIAPTIMHLDKHTDQVKQNSETDASYVIAIVLGSVGIIMLCCICCFLCKRGYIRKRSKRYLNVPDTELINT